MKTTLPELPFASWRPTKETLHVFTQIVGKIRLALAPRRNHWWHITSRVSSRGLTTGAIPFAAGTFEIEFDFVDHGVDVTTSNGGRARIALRDGLSVAAFHRELFRHLETFGIRPKIRAVPYDLPFSRVPFAKDERHAAYDAEAVAKFGAMLRWTADVLERFAATFGGKTSPVHFFWHSFDLALTRFSGRRAAPIPGANRPTREAYSHEVASYGFWAGDAWTPSPTFYGYAAPVPAGLLDEKLTPRGAKWVPGTGQARLDWDVVRKSPQPRDTLLTFFGSVDAAIRRRANWRAAESREIAGT